LMFLEMNSNRSHFIDCWNNPSPKPVSGFISQ
jgi:hypothetical protein